MTRAVAHNVAALLARAAHAWPALPALATGTRVTHDYRAFVDAAASLAAGLAKSGLAAGDRVAIVARNTSDYIVALFATWWAGAVAVPVNAKLHPRELAFVLQDSGARVAFVDETSAVAVGSVDTPGTSVTSIVTRSMEMRPITGTRCPARWTWVRLMRIRK